MFSKSQIMHINSANRVIDSTSSDSDFDIVVPIDTLTEWKYVVLLDASIPKSYYNISAGRSSFTVSENGVDRTVSITAGNYNRKQLSQALTAALNTGTYIYSITYGPSGSTYCDLGKYTFTVSNNSGVQPIFTFTTRFSENIGFEINSYQFSANSLTTPNVSNLSLESNLFIHSDICKSIDGSDVLQHIIATSDPTFSNIAFRSPTPEYYLKPFVHTADNYFYFRLMDEFGQLIDLNGLNMVFTIMVLK